MVVFGYFLFLAVLAGIVVIGWIGFSQDNVPAVVNVFVSGALALLPIVIDGVGRFVASSDVGFGPWLPTAVAVIGLCHSYGMLGPYDEIWWWDHLTHTLAAAIIAALVYSALVGINAGSNALISALTIGYTLLIGIFWEVIELVAREVGKQLDVRPVLVHYGWRDTILDLVFDVVGAVIVVVVGFAPFVPIARQYPATAGSLLEVIAGVSLVGSITLGLLVVFSLNHRQF